MPMCVWMADNSTKLLTPCICSACVPLRPPKCVFQERNVFLFLHIWLVCYPYSREPPAGEMTMWEIEAVVPQMLRVNSLKLGNYPQEANLKIAPGPLQEASCSSLLADTRDCVLSRGLDSSNC